MKKISILLVLLLTSSVLLAQKFKDVFPEIAKASDEEALALIKEYLIEDLDHPNCNLRLALIYENRYRNSDPITEYERAMANANEAKLRYTKSAGIINEKEVKKNPGYYADFSTGLDNKGRPIVDYTTVNQKIISGYDSAKIFTAQLPIIYEYFTKSVNFHDKAIKAFNEINGQFNSRDKLLLMHDSNLNFKLEDLISDYDSSIYNLETYLEAAAAFDPVRFDQQYTIRKIDTYGLQGLLTSPNFLIENIEIWDYKKWAQEVMKEADTEISDLRKELNAAEVNLNSSLKSASPKVNITNYSPYEVDSKLIFNLVKYDNQSLPVSLLRYKQHKQDLVHQLGKVNDRDTTESTEAFMVNLGDLLYKSVEADSLLVVSNNRINIDAVAQYENYFTLNYKGLDGVNKFIIDERKMANESKSIAVSEMLSTVNKLEKAKPSSAEYISYRRIKIPLKIEPFSYDSLDAQLKTVKVLENADGSKYLAGIKKKKEDLVIVYLAKANASGKAEWYKEYTFTEEDAEINNIGDISITPEGCAIMVRSTSAAGVINTLHYVGVDGTIIFSKPIELSTFPRKMSYVESTNAFLMLYKGDQQKQQFKTREPSQVMSINILGDILWSQEYNYAGTIEELLAIGEGFLIIGNYSEINDPDGKSYKTKVTSGQTNAFAARFTKAGKLASVQTIESASNYVVNKVIKVNDRIINLLGNAGTIEEPASQPIHIIINSGPQVLHSDL